MAEVPYCLLLAFIKREELETAAEQRLKIIIDPGKLAQLRKLQAELEKIGEAF